MGNKQVQQEEQNISPMVVITEEDWGKDWFYSNLEGFKHTHTQEIPHGEVPILCPSCGQEIPCVTESGDIASISHKGVRHSPCRNFYNQDCEEED